MITNPNVTEYYYINNIFADFYKSTLDYLSESFGDRFKNNIMGTYDKTVQYLRNLELNENREMDMELLPTIAVNPIGEFDLSDVGGKQPWRFPNTSPAFGSKLTKAIYQDENVKITPCLSRIQGEIEVIFLLSSFYEFCDVRFLLLHGFNGIGRKVYPFTFNTFIILPDELYFYEYDNDVTNENYVLDWSNSIAELRLIKSINQNKYIYPVVCIPQFTLQSMGDNSKKYGGTDELTEWRLIATFKYEMELPTFLYTESNYLARGINLNTQLGSAYSYYSWGVPTNILRSESNWTSEIDENEQHGILITSNPVITDKSSLELKIRYYHIITEEEELSDDNIEILLPEEITDPELIKIFISSDELVYSNYYYLENNTIIIRKDTVTLNKNDLVELFIYKNITVY